MLKLTRTCKNRVLGQRYSLLFKFKIKKVTTFACDHSMNQVWAPLSWLKVHQSQVRFSQPTYHQGKEEGLHRENGWRGKLRLKLRARCKSWAIREKGFWKSFLILLFMCLNDSSIPLLNEKNMLIWFGDGLQ
jgi:hypothetical protein